MKHRMPIQYNEKYIPQVTKVVDLCSKHISPLTAIGKPGVMIEYCGKGWHVRMIDGTWYLEVDREEDLVYISLLI